MKVSVVVLTQNMPSKLYTEIMAQTYNLIGEMEIIIADQEGIVNAMNIALLKTKGDIFVRIDDDVILSSNWLKELVKPFNDPQVIGVTGPTFINKDRRAYRDSIRLAEKPNFFLRWIFDNDPFAPAKIYKCGSVSYGSNFVETLPGGEIIPDHLEGTNWAMRTEHIRAVGGFDTAFDGVAEWYDTDVEFKIKKKYPGKFVYNQKAVLWHDVKFTSHYNDRFEGWGRIKNFLLFHSRHGKFHPKMIIWVMMMLGYFFVSNCKRFLKIK